MKDSSDLPKPCWPMLVTGAGGLLGYALGPRLAQAAPAPEALVLTDLAPGTGPAGVPIRPLDVT
ncbi:MAG: hypothetical protein WBD63_12420, partial [Phycisphaerae bacterium]